MIEEKYHRKIRMFLDLLKSEFKVEHVECIYRNFDVIKCIYKAENWMNSKEIALLLKMSDQRSILKIKELTNNRLLKIARIKKNSNLRVRNHYNNILTEEFILKFEKFTKCINCDTRFGKFGGIIHINISSDNVVKIFCSIKCRGEWFDNKDNNK